MHLKERLVARDKAAVQPLRGAEVDELHAAALHHDSLGDHEAAAEAGARAEVLLTILSTDA